MKRLTGICAAALVAGLCGACTQFGMFDDVGTDPHPPSITLVGIAYQPAESSDGTTPAPKLTSPDGFVIRPTDNATNKIMLRVTYADVGGDVQNFMIRDLNSALNQRLTPTAPEVDIDGDGVAETLDTPDFFSGTSGTVDLENVSFTSYMLGEHRLEVWGEDSHGSRSEKISFTVQFLP